MTGRAMLRLSPIALLVVVAACGGGSSPPPTVGKTKTERVRVYFLQDGKVQPVARRIPVSDAPEADAYVSLRNGPTQQEHAFGLTTATIPDPGSLLIEPTKLGMITSGPPEQAALAQIVYTLTQFPTRRAVIVNGKRYARSDFEDFTPLILVESPLPFAHVTSPLRVTGTADTFEATFDYDLLDASGKLLAHHFVTATSGNGVRGTFAFTARFTVPKEQQGKLVAYEISAKDGSRIHQSEIPLTLEP